MHNIYRAFVLLALTPETPMLTTQELTSLFAKNQWPNSGPTVFVPNLDSFAEVEVLLPTQPMSANIYPTMR